MKKLNKISLILTTLIVIFTFIVAFLFKFISLYVSLAIIVVSGLLLFIKNKYFKVFHLLLVSVLLVFGSLVSSVTSKITSNEEKNTSYLVALKASEAPELKSGQTVAVQQQDSHIGFQMFDQYFSENNLEMEYKTHEDYVSAVDSLYNKEVDYAIVNSLSNPEITSNYKNFSDDVVVVHQLEQKTEVEASDADVQSDSINILLAGTDSRGSDIDENGRTDSIMVATYNPRTNHIVLTSLPRDAYVYNTCGGYKDKLTHVSNGGMQCLISTLEQELAIKIDFYVKFNFNVLVEVIDLVGGVEVDVEAGFCTVDQAGNVDAICLEPGVQNLNGAEALAYSRERKSFADGDYARIRHQQQVLTALFAEINDLSVSEFISIVDSISDSVRTNLSEKQIMQLFNAFIQSEPQVESQTILGVGGMTDIPQVGLYGTSVQYLDETSKQQAVTKINDVYNENPPSE